MSGTPHFIALDLTVLPRYCALRHTHTQIEGFQQFTRICQASPGNGRFPGCENQLLVLIVAWGPGIQEQSGGISQTDVQVLAQPLTCWVSLGKWLILSERIPHA